MFVGVGVVVWLVVVVVMVVNWCVFSMAWWLVVVAVVVAWRMAWSVVSVFRGMCWRRG